MNNLSNPLISIILPTYNVAPYLLQCLESVNKQTYENYEVIIIIDGATDGSFEIAKEFCKSHSKFSVYWQENAGSGPARNAGLAKASGEFIMFIDPDDWIDKDLVKNLVEGQFDGNYDLVATQRTRALCDNNGNLLKITLRHYKDKSINDKAEVRESFFEMVANGVAGNPTQKLYRMSIIKKYDIQFPALRRSQDVVFNYRYYEHIESLRLLHYSGYFYRVLLENSSGRSSVDYYKVIESIYNGYKELYNSWEIPFPEKDFCTYFFEIRVFTNLQRCAIQNWDVKPIVDNIAIDHIIKNAKPKSFVKKIALYLILRKRYRLLMKFMKVVVYLKQSGAVKR